MTNKLVFSVPDTPTGLQAVEFLKMHGVGESDISVLGNEVTELSSIPEPGEFENDVVPGSKRGAVVGGATGLLIGLGAVLVAPGLAIGGAALALATAGGATFGVLASTLIGSSVTNSQIQQYEKVLDRGELLMILELDADKAADIASQLQSQFPAIERMGEIDAVPSVV